MTRLPTFQLHEPRSLEEAAKILEGYGEDARPIAGGTALVPMMRFGLLRPGHLVSLQRIPDLDCISVRDGGLHIGALATHRQVASSSEVRERWPLLTQATASVATPAIRTAGTLGGNLCYAEAASDPAPALLALGASIHLIDSEGEREVPIDQFFLGFYEADIQPGEILASIFVPPTSEDARFSYLRYAARSREDKPLVNVAALATQKGVRIGLGGVSPTPIRAKQAEEILQSTNLTAEAIDLAAKTAAEECDPLDDLMGSADYRRDMVRVYVRRALSNLTLQAS